MKWILIITLIAVIMMIAYSLSEQYKDKYDFYLNLKNFLNQYKINVSFRQEKINEFLSSLKPKKQFKLFIEAYRTYLKSDNLNLEQIKVLDAEEKNELSAIVTRLGSLDCHNEIGQVETYLSSVDIKLTKALEDKNKLCPMILKLSLLFALGLSIILI